MYDKMTALIAMLGPRLGADEVWVYDDRWLVEHRKEFVEHNRWLWDHPHKRGFGWYAWKPFILLDALDRMRDGDVVLYTDADTCPVDDFSVLYDTCARDGGIMLFRAGGPPISPFKQGQWCKRDCFVVMGQDEARYREADAGVARFVVFQKGPWRARQFLMEWLAYCVNPRATTFDPSVLGAEPPEFIEHRTEQAIMTNLAHKYGLRLYREACEAGNGFPEDKDLYGQLFGQLNTWGNRTAPCKGSRFANVGPSVRVPGGPPFEPAHAEAACVMALNHAAARNFKAAERILQAVLEHFPRNFPALCFLGQIKEALRDYDCAIATYDRASALNPGQALPFTRRAIVSYRRDFGNPPPARAADPAKGFATMRSLGGQGRFGNQILQYGALRLYADRAGVQAMAPDWIGRDLFGLDDPLPCGAKETLPEEQVMDVLLGRAKPRPNVDLSGYFCGDMTALSAHRSRFQALFVPVGAARRAGEQAMAALRALGRTVVAVHLRRGDFGAGRFWIAPGAWYLQWLRSEWGRLDKPLLYVATDDPATVAEFEEFRPMVAGQVSEPLPGAEFFVDHWVLRNADLLAVSNSTFSVTAGLLNERASGCFRPDRAAGGLRAFDPWAEKVLLD